MQEKTQYTDYMKSLGITKSMFEAAFMEGEIKGEIKGGKKVKFKLANKYMANGMDKATALEMVELTEQEYDEIGEFLRLKEFE